MEGDLLQAVSNQDFQISIHTLRVEGDILHISPYRLSLSFQSTPSVWRVTISPIVKALTPLQFQSTPSVWRVTAYTIYPTYGNIISIHTLRVEGDCIAQTRISFCRLFQSTPSVWRVTDYTDQLSELHDISIHTLRVEGDSDYYTVRYDRFDFNPHPPCGG